MLNYRATYYTKEVLLNSKPSFSQTGNRLSLDKFCLISHSAQVSYTPHKRLAVNLPKKSIRQKYYSIERNFTNL